MRTVAVYGDCRLVLTAQESIAVRSNDVEKFCDSILTLHYMWISPCGILIIIGYMCSQLGIAAVFGSILVMSMVSTPLAT